MIRFGVGTTEFAFPTGSPGNASAVGVQTML